MVLSDRLDGKRLPLVGASGRGEVFRQWVVVPPERADEWEPFAAEAVGQDHGIAPT